MPEFARPLLRFVLGDVLRQLRLEQRRTLADVAADARVSVPYLSEVERGRKEASSEVLAAVCDALRTDLAEVLAEVGRELVEDRERRARVLRLEAVRQRRAVTALPVTSAPVTAVPRSPAAPGASAARGVVCLAA